MREKTLRPLPAPGAERGGFSLTALEMALESQPMSWRRLNLILFVLMVVVGVLRLFTGNLLGALIPLAVAVYCGSVAFDYPVVTRARQIGRFLFRRKKS